MSFYCRIDDHVLMWRWSAKVSGTLGTKTAKHHLPFGIIDCQAGAGAEIHVHKDESPMCTFLEAELPVIPERASIDPQDRNLALHNRSHSYIRKLPSRILLVLLSKTVCVLSDILGSLVIGYWDRIQSSSTDPISDL